MRRGEGEIEEEKERRIASVGDSRNNGRRKRARERRDQTGVRVVIDRGATVGMTKMTRIT